MFFKDIMQEQKHNKPGNPDLKKFKTSTGSPILYSRFKKHRGIYYPLAKHHIGKRYGRIIKHDHKHVCVVYSRTYGREMYSNIDIWPDDDEAKERLLEKLQAMAREGLDDDELLDDELLDDDVGIDIPASLVDVDEQHVPERCNR